MSKTALSGKYAAYPEYKDSGVEWLGNVPSHWKQTKIAWHFTAEKGRNGQLLTKEYCASNSGIYPVYSGQTENKGVMGTIDKYEFDTGEEGVLFSTTVGAKAMTLSHLKNKFSLSQNCMIIVKNSDQVLTRFSYYHFQPLFAYERSLIPEHMQASFRMEDLYRYPFAIPELKEQIQIAAFLDHETAKIDTLIEKQQQLIELLKEKRQAVISHAVTKGLNPDVPMKDSGVEWLGEVPEHWEVINMNHVLNAIGDVDHYMPQSIDKGIPYVMTGDLTELASGINFDNCKQVSHQDYLKLSNKIKSTKGDVIMARYATIGTVSYIDIDKDFLVSYSCVTIKPNLEKVSGLYLYYYFKSHAFLEGIQSQINTNTQGNVGVNDLKKIKVSLPTLREQLNIVEYLQSTIDKFDALTQKSKNAIKLMQERRTALISAAVTGKIDVRNWVAPTTSSYENEAVQEVTA